MHVNKHETSCILCIESVSVVDSYRFDIMSLRSSEDEQSFESLEDLLLRINEHVDLEDYVVVLLRIKKSKLRVKRKAWIKCDREEKIRESQNQDKRHNSNRLIDCSFFLIAKRENEEVDSLWLLKMTNSEHNYSSSLASAHLVLRKIAMHS